MLRHLSILKFQFWPHSDVVDSYIDYIERYIIRKDVYNVLLVQDKIDST